MKFIPTVCRACIYKKVCAPNKKRIMTPQYGRPITIPSGCPLLKKKKNVWSVS